MAAMRIAALHNGCESAILRVGRCDRRPTMGFYTELFSRPRPREDGRYRAALAILYSTSNADRRGLGVSPADFPRIAREMVMK